jgi:hypothetical protein
MNRMGAKVCSQCGSKFHPKLITTRGRSKPGALAARAQVQKWCPQCGAERREGAKVCSFCGYYFKDAAAPKPQRAEPPFEAPITQASAQAEPAIQNVATTPPEPKPRDLSGEPAPYITQEELERLRRMGGERPNTFVRLFKAIRDDKP